MTGVQTCALPIYLGELDLQGHLDPTTVTGDEIQELLDSVADGGH